MGHGDAGGEELDQPDVDGQPGQEDPLRRGSEAPLDLRKTFLVELNSSNCRTNESVCAIFFISEKSGFC